MRTKSSQRNKINIITLGCSKNLYDTQVLINQLKESGKDVVHEKKGDIVVINTCGFIDSAKQESINCILENIKLKELGVIQKVFVTGCLSQRYKEDLQKEIPDVDQYFGTKDLPLLLKVLGADYKHELVGERIITTPRHYAYLKISEGCDRPCSFCAIPFIRGGHISTPIEKLIDIARKMADGGVKELILIAQDLTYYGLDLYKKRALADLLKELVKIDKIKWIRLHYAFPSGFPQDVLDVMKNEPKICNYIDIPLQHISDNILKSMKRGINQVKINDLLDKFRNKIPNIAIRTTLIIGYPGESQDDFEQLKQWVKNQKFDRLGCFPYSHEENTSAYFLEDNVSEKEKNIRVNQIMDIQASISYKLNQEKIGKIFRCIVDGKEGDFFLARTQYDSPDVDNQVLISATDCYLRTGDFVDVRVTDATEFDLYGNVVDEI